MTADLLAMLRQAATDPTKLTPEQEAELPEGSVRWAANAERPPAWRSFGGMTVAGRLLLEALEERERLLAPVENVELVEVLRLDGEATPGPWDADHSWWPGEVTDEYAAVGPVHTLRKYDFLDLDTPEKRAALDVAMMGVHADQKLVAYYRTAAPILAREVARLRVMVADYQALAAHREGEIDAERQRFKLINEAISARSWGLFDVLDRLAEGADRLFTVHGCDAHGYETLMAARDSAREIGPALREALKPK